MAYNLTYSATDLFLYPGVPGDLLDRYVEIGRRLEWSRRFVTPCIFQLN